MDRRKFAQTSLTVAGAISAGSLLTVAAAQTPTSSPDASPTAGTGTWQSADDPITVEFDASIFGEASTSGVTGEWCVLRIEDIDRFLSFIIKLEDKFPTDEEELRDLVTNDTVLEYPEAEGNIERIEVTEDNGAFGVLYQPELGATPDQWAYSEFIPSTDGSHRTIELWIASRVSKLDRELMEAAVTSVKINGEQAVRAIEVAHLFDQVEAMEVDTAE